MGKNKQNGIHLLKKQEKIWAF